MTAFAISFVLTTMLLLPGVAQTAPPSSSAKRLNALLAEEWDYEMRTSPETATSYGDFRFNDKLSDVSPSFYAWDVQQKKKFLDEFEAVPEAGLSADDQ